MDRIWTNQVYFKLGTTQGIFLLCSVQIGWVVSETKIFYDFFAQLCLISVNGNKGLCRVKHDKTAACWQGQVEQVYIKRGSGHSILLDTVNCWTQYCVQQFTVSSKILCPDPLLIYTCSTCPCQHAAVLSCFTLHSPLLPFTEIRHSWAKKS